MYKDNSPHSRVVRQVLSISPDQLALFLTLRYFSPERENETRQSKPLAVQVVRQKNLIPQGSIFRPALLCCQNSHRKPAGSASSRRFAVFPPRHKFPEEVCRRRSPDK